MARHREQRRAARIQPFVAACRVLAAGERLVGYVTDLSTEGCQVATQSPPPALAATVVLEIRLGRGAAHTRLPARVIWTRARSTSSGADTFGLVFDGLDDAQRRALGEVVEAFRRKAAEIDG
ncbi:MAG TPA: PilZ domain-containing protein [Vicinamibacteria bacterium]